MSTKAFISKPRILYSAIVLALAGSNANATQYDSGTLAYSYSGSLWGADIPGGITIDKFLGSTISPAAFDLGKIELGTGFDIFAGIGPGKVGLDLGGHLDVGELNVNYSADVKLNLPSAPVLNNSFVSLSGSIDNAKSNISSALGNLSAFENLVFQSSVFLTAKGCFAGSCASSSKTLNPDINFPLVSFNANNSNQFVVLGTTQQTGPGVPFQLNASVDLDGVSLGTNLGSVTYYNPSLNASGSGTGGAINTSNSTDLLNLNLDAGNIVSILSGNGATNWIVSADPLSVSVTPAALYLGGTLGLDQNLSFNPNIEVDLKFDHPITVDLSQVPAANSLHLTTNDFLVPLSELPFVKFQIDNKTEVTPTFVLDNTFTNHTSLNLDLALNLTFLKLSLDYGVGSQDFNGITVPLGDSHVGNFDVYNQTNTLGFTPIVGKSFTLDTVTQIKETNYVIWTGQGQNGNWSTAANWENNTKPVDGQAILFYGQDGTQTQPVFDPLAGLKTINGITFLEGAKQFHLLSSLALDNTADIINQSNFLQSIKQDINVVAQQTWNGGLYGISYTGQLNIAQNQGLSLKNVLVNTGAVAINNNAALSIDQASAVSADGLTIGSQGRGIVSLFNHGSLTDKGNTDIENGVVKLSSGANIQARTAVFAGNSNAFTDIGLLDSGTHLTVKGAVQLADQGSLTLTVSNGAVLATGDAQLANGVNSNASISLQDNQSTWQVNGSLTAAGAGRTKLTVNNGANLQIASDLKLGTGSGQTSFQVQNGGTATVQGNAEFGSKVQADLVGNAGSTVLQVTGSTNLDNGASVNINNATVAFENGLNIAGVLNGSGISNIAGPLVLGSTGSIFSHGSLSLLDSVYDKFGTINIDAGSSLNIEGAFSGGGRFLGAGSLSFLNTFSFGDSLSSGNASLSTINFDSQNVSFGSSSSLTVDISGTDANFGYNQLQNISNFDFHGKLILNFTDFSSTTALQLGLFGFQTFSGVFATNEIVVTGIDRNRLDFTQLGVDGNLRVNASAVPLPSALWFMASGLGWISVQRRQKRLQP